MKKIFYTIMILVVVLFIGTMAMAASEEAPDNDYFDFSGVEDTIVVPKVIDKATGEVLIEELLLAQVVGGGVVIMTYAMNGEFQETEVAWTKVKVLTPDNQECGIPDLQHVECPGLDEWNESVKEILQ